MRTALKIGILVGLLGYAFPLFAATIQVPEDYITIQAAIDAATRGDVVVVADGTYKGVGNKNLDFKGKAITVKSMNGQENCIIDCENDGRGFNFHSGESALAILKGFTIKNGVSDQGGAIFCGSGSSPSITNCKIIANRASQGAGIYCSTGSPYIKDCTISENGPIFTSGSGAGLFCNNSSVVITRCSFSGNKTGYGGGLYIYGGSATVIDCSFIGNEASGYPSHGGGIVCDNSSSTITRCSFLGNKAGYGGGIACFVGSPTISRCIFSRNKATQVSGGNGGGGAIYCGQAYGQNPTTPVITNCVVIGNEAGHGGGISCDGASITLTNCTISGNSATISSSGGLYCIDSSPSVKNCIFWADSPAEILAASGSPIIEYCNIQGGWPGTGNFSAHPNLNISYQLLQGSPCIDAGYNAALSSEMLTDFDGDPRIIDGNSDGSVVVDIGADELNPLRKSIDIFGLEVGNEWVYEGTNGGNPYTVARKVSMDLTTFPIPTYAHEIKEDGVFSGKEYYEKSSGQVLLWGATTKVDGALYDLKLSKGLPVVSFPVVVGDHQYSTTTGMFAQLPYTFNVSMDFLVVSQENVDLGFDNFESYKVRCEMRVWDMGLDYTDTFFWWVVPYIGPIKDEDAESTVKLTSFAIGGGTVSHQTDADRDGLKDYQELIKYQTDWLDADTDADGMPDGWEAQNGLNPTFNDASRDEDGDGYSNLQEYKARTNPTDPGSKPGRDMPWLQLLLDD